MVADTKDRPAVVEITQAELDELRRQKDELHALKAQNLTLCEHSCAHGHKPLTTSAEEKARMVELNKKIDREEKEARLKEEDKRLDVLIRAGRIDKEQKAKIMAQERERMGL